MVVANIYIYQKFVLLNSQSGIFHRDGRGTEFISSKRDTDNYNFTALVLV